MIHTIIYVYVLDTTDYKIALIEPSSQRNLFAFLEHIETVAVIYESRSLCILLKKKTTAAQHFRGVGGCH